jgi:hypothetical protein
MEKLFLFAIESQANPAVRAQHPIEALAVRLVH